VDGAYEDEKSQRSSEAGWRATDASGVWEQALPVLELVLARLRSHPVRSATLAVKLTGNACSRDPSDEKQQDDSAIHRLGLCAAQQGEGNALLRW
jgi:hypothetical protein